MTVNQMSPTEAAATFRGSVTVEDLTQMRRLILHRSRIRVDAELLDDECVATKLDEGEHPEQLRRRVLVGPKDPSWVTLAASYIIGKPVPAEQVCAPFDPGPLGSLDDCIAAIVSLADLCRTGVVSRAQAQEARALIDSAASIHRSRAGEMALEALADAGARVALLGETESSEEWQESVAAMHEQARAESEGDDAD